MIRDRVYSSRSATFWESVDTSSSTTPALNHSVLVNWPMAPGIQGANREYSGRLWDLLPFVKKHVYHPDFRGSFSIKAVLPALVPDMTYEGMEVAHGGEAGLAWEQMIRGELDPAERQRLKSALLAYCRQDTLAMVKILERLRAFSLNA